ncbi:MAG: hypothetical protein H7144_04570 [Burkholderiales bacterium]|nr:hypothetical protein [Phycisphaerae bacterium]
MAEAIICPDCGGVVGGDRASGVQVCQCFASRGDYEAREQPAVEAARIAAEKVDKRCRVCGKNLSGHRRVKDSRGYMCLPCMKAEEEAAVEGLIACAECGRHLKPDGLIDYHGVRICKKCFNDHKELSRFRAPPPNPALINDHEKQSLKKYLIIAGILLAIIALASLGILGGR